MWYFLSKTAAGRLDVGFEVRPQHITAVLILGILGEYHKLDRWKKTGNFFALLVMLGIGGELLARPVLSSSDTPCNQSMTPK
jgi:hypothetical protein